MGNHSQHPVKNRTPIRRHRFVFLLSGIVLLLIMTPSVTVAQTNDCVDATPISEGTDIPFDTRNDINDNYPDIDDTPWGCGTAAPDVWFAYTASCTGIAIVETTQFDAWCSREETILQAFSACNGTLIACDEAEDEPPFTDHLSTIFLDVTAGSTYYLRISASGASHGNCRGAGLLDISCGQSIGSDECVDATPTGEGTNIIVDTTNATYDPNDTQTCTPQGIDTPDAWIAYTTSCTGIATIRTNWGPPHGDFHEWALVEIFDACGGTALHCINDNVPSEIFLPVTSGSTYFLRVLGTGTEVGLIVLDITCVPIVGSDECADATPVSEGEGIFVDTSSATADATGASCYTDEYPDVWITYTPSDYGVVTIESTYSNQNYPGPGPYGNAVEVLDACGGNVLACDQNNYPGVTMELGFVTPENTYLIRIASRHRDFPPPADTGLNRFNITLAAIENPVCEAATTISPGTISTDTTGAMLTDDIDHLTNCGDSAEWGGDNCNSEMRHPIWFTWTAPTSGTIALNTCGDNCFDDSVLAFYEGECADLLLLECSCYEHHGPCGYYEEYMAALMHPVEAGVTYYIQLGSGGAAEAGGDCEMVFDFFADEDCFNGIDDDGDGLIDCEDQPCSTGIFEQTSPDQSDFGESGGERGQAGVFADFDDDGDNDFFAANNYRWSQGYVDVLWINQGGDQGGTPGEFEPSSQLFPEEETEDVAAGDLDGDGDLDIFCVGKEDHRVWLNDGNGNFTNDWTQDGTPEGWFNGSETVELFDLDDDNDLDAVIGVRNSGLAQVYANNGDGIFTHMPNSADPTDLDANGSQTNCIALGDFDLDGNTDIFLGRAQYIDRIWRGDGFGSFEDTGAIFPSTTTSSVSTSDLDGDGDLDLVITSVPSGNSVVTDPEDAIHGTQIWLNDGSGSFVESGQILNEDYFVPHHTLVDLNMDGHLDLYLSDQIGVLDRIWLNDGSGIFYDAQVALEIRDYDYPPIIGDANNDGIPDLLYRQNYYNYLYLHTFLNMDCLPENCDNRIDDDNDGLIDCADPECTESNGVGCDDDGDGIPNVCDIDSTGGEDCDSDGQDDSCQLAAEDPDGDGDINPCDPDDDNDGYADGDDNCPSVANEDQGDNDRDGIGDVCDTDDIDGDGVLDFEDSAPLDPYQCRDVDNDDCDDCSSGVDNPAEDGTDTDSDGLCDFGDPDDDDDGVLDGDDNCPIVPNPDQNEVLVAEATQIDFALRTFSDDATVLEMEDDDVQSVTIPFAIPFAGGSYTEVFVSSNGFVTFDNSDDSGCCSGQELPEVGEPNNLVAGYWNDLDPSSGGTIKWEVFGEEGARELVIGFEEVPHCCSDGNSEVSFQIVLSEAGYAEVHCDICHDDDEGYHTQGAEGPNGQLAAVLEDRNYGAFTLLEDGARYVLQALDNDQDGLNDQCDVDDDNDGVPDSDDDAPFDNTICRDLDNDGCDDCSSGVDDPAADGPDTDADGQCDFSDPDDDNDGVADGDDNAPLDNTICRDLDNDGCDDCSSGVDDPSNDGADFDNDGICDAGDDDDDNDGSLDTDDDDDNNPNVCSDTDGDGCDDCSSGIYDPSSDGADYDNDGLCDDGDDDDDNDGALDDDDDDDTNPNVCSDTDGDGCDDCSNGSYDPSSDGADFDNDGLCDAGDDDDDNDGALDNDDNDDNNPNVCSDTDGDGCDDCSSGTYAPSDDGTDTDGDGLCDSGDPDPNGWYLHFIRGDANNDGQVDTADAIYTLAAQFYGGPTWPCRDSADINNDEEIDVADAIYCLSYIFLDGAAPLAPFPGCGQDEAEPAGLTCEAASPGCP